MNIFRNKLHIVVDFYDLIIQLLYLEYIIWRCFWNNSVKMCLKTLEIQREREGGEGVMLGPARVRVERRMEVGGEGEPGKMGQMEGSERESKGKRMT